MAQRDTTNNDQAWKQGRDTGKQGIPGAERSRGKLPDEADEDESEFGLDAEEERELDLEDDSYVEEDVASDFQEQRTGSRRSALQQEGRPARE